MARDLESLETELGKLDSDMDVEAGKVFDKIEAVRAKAPDVFKRTHARIDAKAKSVDRVDALLMSLDRVNEKPTSTGSSNGLGISGANAANALYPVQSATSGAVAALPNTPTADSAEKKS